MKKAIIPVVLLLALIFAMSTGSLALYTQTQVLRGQLYTRIFLLRANEKSTSYELDLDGLALMPGEAEKGLYRFELTNSNDAADICDYVMTVSICSQGIADATAGMDGLVFFLYDETSESGTPVATVTDGELAYDDIVFQPGVKKSILYRLTAKWNDTGDSSAQTALAASGQQYPVKIIVTATAEN